MKPNYHYKRNMDPDIQELRTLALIAYGKYRQVLGEDNWKTMESGLSAADTYEQLLRIACCFTCEKDDEIVGMAFLIPSGNPNRFFQDDWTYIRLVGVHPAHEGNGIGKRLTQMCIDQAALSGESTLALHTSEMQEAARHIYETIGFTPNREFELYGKRYWIYTLQLKSSN